MIETTFHNNENKTELLILGQPEYLEPGERTFFTERIYYPGQIPGQETIAYHPGLTGLGIKNGYFAGPGVTIRRVKVGEHEYPLARTMVYGPFRGKPEFEETLEANRRFLYALDMGKEPNPDPLKNSLLMMNANPPNDIVVLTERHVEALHQRSANLEDDPNHRPENDPDMELPAQMIIVNLAKPGMRGIPVVLRAADCFPVKGAVIGNNGETKGFFLGHGGYPQIQTGLIPRSIEAACKEFDCKPENIFIFLDEGLSAAHCTIKEKDIGRLDTTYWNPRYIPWGYTDLWNKGVKEMTREQAIKLGQRVRFVGIAEQMFYEFRYMGIPDKNITAYYGSPRVDTYEGALVGEAASNREYNERIGGNIAMRGLAVMEG